MVFVADRAYEYPVGEGAKESLLAGEEKDLFSIEKYWFGFYMGQGQHTAIKELFFFFFNFPLTELLEPEKMSKLMKRCS